MRCSASMRRMLLNTTPVKMYDVANYTTVLLQIEPDPKHFGAVNVGIMIRHRNIFSKLNLQIEYLRCNYES